MLKLCIVGQDTLAATTLECCARHFAIVPTPRHDPSIFWVCYDTPIGADDAPDGTWIIDRIREHLVDLDTRPLILISSQMPVGTVALLEQEFPEHTFGCQPENIRVASAVSDFEDQARIVVGVRTTEYHILLHELFAPFTDNLIITTPETAELCKHALNCFLGLQIAFVNEFSKVCAVTGGDIGVVSQSLLAERRISPKAPLRAGAPFGGGHLSRDIYVVNEIAAKHGLTLPLISNIKRSNES